MSRYKSQVTFCWWVALLATAALSLHPEMGPPSAPLFDIGLDKFIHMGTYLVLAIIPALFFARGGAVVRSVILVAAMSFSIELAQDLVPGRLFSVGDAVANMLGVFLGVVIGLYWRRLKLDYYG